MTLTTEPAVTLALPRRWTTRDDPAPGVVLLARAPSPTAAGLIPELVLRTGPIGDDLTLDEWREEAMAALGTQLRDLEIEDSDLVDLDGEPARYLRFGHRLGDVDVLCEQWAWLYDGLGVTLTGSVARADYADYCDLFEDVAATVRLVRRAVA